MASRTNAKITNTYSQSSRRSIGTLADLPVAPIGPVFPVAPVAPIAPAAPVAPVLPVQPWSPGLPWFPWSPRGPRSGFWGSAIFPNLLSAVPVPDLDRPGDLGRVLRGGGRHRDSGLIEGGGQQLDPGHDDRHAAVHQPVDVFDALLVVDGEEQADQRDAEDEQQGERRVVHDGHPGDPCDADR